MQLKTGIEEARAKIDLVGLDSGEIDEIIREMPGARPYTSRQLYAWIYAKRSRDFAEMTNLPGVLRTHLERLCEIGSPAIDTVATSTDGTRKYLLSLHDRERIESVWIPEPARNTMCLSTQVGCRMGCTFCATALMGLRRNLTSGEIVGQALRILDDIGYRDRRVNVVFMGMGEGLDNYDQLMKAFRLLADPDGVAISPRRITLSTVGLVPGIERLALEPKAPKLAVSLNSPFDHERSDVMPINRKYSLSRLMDAIAGFMSARHHGKHIRLNERVTFEYVLMKGVNDSPAHARELIRLLRHLPAKLNLLAYNPTPQLPFERPDDTWIESFKTMLLDANVPVSFRRSRGRDIAAACGQLVTEQTAKAQRSTGSLHPTS